MEKLTMCRICLIEDVRMYVVANRQLQETFEKLTDVPFITEDSRPMLACFFCYAKLKQCSQFHKKCMEAENVFNQMLNEEYEQKPIKFDTILEFFGGFSKTGVQHIDILEVDQTDETDSVKEENHVTIEHEDVELKKEDDIDLEGTILQEDVTEVEHIDSGQYVPSDSEDDVPLMKLKTEAEDELPKKKKNRIKKIKPKLDCREIILSKEQQMLNLQAREKSANYKNAPYKCVKCFRGFVVQKTYEKHLMQHDASSGKYECDICHKFYRSVQHLRTHAHSAHIRIFKCNKCDYNSHTGAQALIHEKWHSGHTYECTLCSHTFTKPTSYYSHMRQRHPTGEFVCNICGEPFLGIHGLKMHKGKAHVDEKMKDPDDPDDPAHGRYCSDCNIQFYNHNAWQRHMLSSVRHVIKTEDRKECPICSWRYQGGTTLEAHVREHQRLLRPSRNPAADRERRCQQCGVMCPSNSKLQAHVKKVHSKCTKTVKSIKNIVCEVCGKKCASNAALKYHQRTHTGEKPYSCTSCSKQFKDSYQLRIHIRTHTGEKPYVCAVCGKGFAQKPAINRHYRTHTGARPYTCQYCSRTFAQSTTMKVHIKSVHLKEPTPPRKRNKKSAVTKIEKNSDE